MPARATGPAGRARSALATAGTTAVVHAGPAKGGWGSGSSGIKEGWPTKGVGFAQTQAHLSASALCKACPTSCACAGLWPNLNDTSKQHRSAICGATVHFFDFVVSDCFYGPCKLLKSVFLYIKNAFFRILLCKIQLFSVFVFNKSVTRGACHDRPPARSRRIAQACRGMPKTLVVWFVLHLKRDLQPCTLCRS